MGTQLSPPKRGTTAAHFSARVCSAYKRVWLSGDGGDCNTVAFQYIPLGSLLLDIRKVSELITAHQRVAMKESDAERRERMMHAYRLSESN